MPQTETYPQVDLIAFCWGAPENSFEWITSTALNAPRESDLKRFLVIKADTEGRRAVFRAYDPFRETGLFRIFSDTQSTEDGIVSFAKEYGFLGSDGTRFGPPSESLGQSISSGKNRYVTVPGEQFESWIAAQKAMRDGISLWDAVNQRNEQKLGTLINWADDTHVSYTGPSDKTGHRLEFEIVSARDTDLFKRFTPGDLHLPAQYALQRIVNRNMRDHASTVKLLWDWTRRRPDLRIQQVPGNLLAAMWLQFAGAIDGNRDYRRCDTCKKWFEVAAAAREDAKYCRDACRFKAYRERQKRARGFSNSGTAVEEIALKLESDVKTVKKWLKK